MHFVSAVLQFVDVVLHFILVVQKVLVAFRYRGTSVFIEKLLPWRVFVWGNARGAIQAIGDGALLP